MLLPVFCINRGMGDGNLADSPIPCTSTAAPLLNECRPVLLQISNCVAVERKHHILVEPYHMNEAPTPYESQM